MTFFKIRYNHDCSDNIHYWRVLINGTEHTASEIILNIPSRTTKDELPGGIIKFHISCESDYFRWEESRLIIG